MKGKLIVIDGADGSGKATQTRLLVERLMKEGYDTEALDFPRYADNTFGALIRECLDGKRGDFMNIDPKVASVLYAADRYESRKKLTSWLEAGKVVVLDRYVSANMMHQGAKIDDEDEAKEFLSWLDHIEHGVFEVPRPNSIVYLDVPYSVRQKLMEKDTTRSSIDVAESHDQHQTACEERAKAIVANNNAWHLIPCVEGGGMKSIEDIHEEVYRVVSKVVTS